MCMYADYSISKLRYQDWYHRRTNVKIRAVCLIDYEIEGSFKEAAEEQARLEEAIKGIVDNNPRVVHHQVDLKERRGSPPDITKMKFRST